MQEDDDYDCHGCTLPQTPNGGNGGGSGDNGNNDHETPDEALDVDRPLYAICMVGGVFNPEIAADVETGTAKTCQGLKDQGEISDFAVIGNNPSDWYLFWQQSEALLVDQNLMIIGYSAGGSGAMELAYYLNSKNRDVSFLFLIDPAFNHDETWTVEYFAPGLDYQTVPGNVESAYMFLENGKEPQFFVGLADLATLGNNDVDGLDHIYYIFDSHHGSIDENSESFVAALLP